jgi:two-component system chemotaxis response regulator CheY
MRSLIAEDDQTCALIMSTLLKRYGSPEVVSDGDAAIRAFTAGLAARNPFDLVCLDIIMPGFDGAACLRCLRAIESGFGREGGDRCRILMASSVHTTKSILTSFRDQCDGYLLKPITRANLAKELAELGFTATAP